MHHHLDAALQYVGLPEQANFPDQGQMISLILGTDKDQLHEAILNVAWKGKRYLGTTDGQISAPGTTLHGWSPLQQHPAGLSRVQHAENRGVEKGVVRAEPCRKQRKSSSHSCTNMPIYSEDISILAQPS